MGFVGTFVSALLIMVVGGMSWFAYKHPNGYAKLWVPLNILGYGTFMLIAAYNFGRSTAYIDSIKAVTDRKDMDAIDAAVEANDVNMLLVIGLFLGFAFLHSFLRYVLPYLMSDESKRA